MRANLLHPLADRRPARRASRRRSTQQSSAGGAETHRATASRPDDSATQRVRDAGGPIDRASYSCECGLLFQAKVSTTVKCPHCGAGQAW
ncbi:MAG TPA: hypothetical protein VGO14_00280 [Solirubrobacteraceae bacterium]|jgi:hypothetical protein|nr:hypothetical protein [Solirubrobacteraceae bacterium]